VGSTESPARLGDEELRQFGLAYGLVNPFETWEPNEIDGRALQSRVLQVFDYDLLAPLGTPGTVMTNAGDLTWAVEFSADELFASLDADVAMSGEIAVTDQSAPPRPPYLQGRRGIGLITGNSPESGIALWNRINGHVRALLGDSNVGDASMPPVRVASLPELGMTMELDQRAEHVWRALKPVIDEMCNTDVALLAIACNTTQFFVKQIRERCDTYGVEFVCLPEVVAAWLEAESVKEVAIVGIPWVSDLDLGWSAYASPFGRFKVERLGSTAPQRLMDLAYQVKEDGPNETGLNKLRSILSQEVNSSHVVLALTELSVLLALQKKPGRSGKVIVDPIDLYGEALARKWLGLAFPAADSGWEVAAFGATHHGSPHGAEGTLGSDLHNEDALVIGSAVVQQPDNGASNPAVGYRHERLSRDTEMDQFCVAVVDGLGGHAAAREAGRLVANRLRDAAMNCHDEDEAVAMLTLIEDELVELSKDDRAGGESPRGVTASGLIAISGGDPGGSLALLGFIAGDCLMMRLASSEGSPMLEWASTRLRPQVGPNGELAACLGGGRRGTFEVEPVARVVEDATFVLCTDGLPRNLGLSISEDLPRDLSLHPLLKDVWEQVDTPGRRDSDRRLVERVVQFPLAITCEGTPDNISIVLVRLRRVTRPKLVTTQRER